MLACIGPSKNYACICEEDDGELSSENKEDFLEPLLFVSSSTVCYKVKMESVSFCKQPGQPYKHGKLQYKELHSVY